jgi:DHA1 family tetracycline resistance protein-like MFS transporter
MPAHRAAFGFIFVSAVVSAAAFSIVIPVLPVMVRELEGGDEARAAEWMMLFTSAFGLAQFVCAPILGLLSDRFGRRPVLILSSLGLAADFLFMALAPNVGWLLVGRVVGGMTAATFAAANAYVADVTAPQDRAKAFGWMSSALAVGFMAGPALGGFLGDIHTRLPFAVAAAVTFANLAYGVFVLPESLPPARRVPRLDWSRATPLGSLRLFRSQADLLPLALVGLLAAFANAIWGSVWVLYCGHRFGWSAGVMGLQIMASGLLGLAVQARLVGPIVARLGDRGAVVAGAVVNAAALAWAGWSPNGLVFVLSMPIAALGLVFQPALDAMLTKRVQADNQGRLQGAIRSLNALAIVIGPVVYGSMFAWSVRQSGADLSGLALFQAAAFMAGAALIALRTSKTAILTAAPGSRI